MALISVRAERTFSASPKQAYRTIADYRKRTAWLPPAYADYTVIKGGSGAGTEVRYVLNAGRRSRPYHMVATEPGPRNVLREADTGSSFVTTYRVEPDGAKSKVSIETSWQGAGGIGGFFERAFAPRAVRRLHTEALERLEAVLRG